MVEHMVKEPSPVLRIYLPDFILTYTDVYISGYILSSCPESEYTIS